MRKQLLSAIAVTILVMSACAQTRKATTKVQASPAITYISMERTNCFGTCPHYIIEMHEEGKVKYSGRMFAKPRGDYETTVDKKNIAKIFDEFRQYRADTCSEEYTVMVSDFPGLNYVIKYENGRTQNIKNAGFGPGFLKTLAKKIDDTIKPDSSSWKKTADFKERD